LDGRLGILEFSFGIRDPSGNIARFSGRHNGSRACRGVERFSGSRDLRVQIGNYIDGFLHGSRRAGLGSRMLSESRRIFVQ
jgi:hypothetical protein